MSVDTHIRLSPQTHATLKELAKRNKRSLAKEIEYALDAYARRQGTTGSSEEPKS